MIGWATKPFESPNKQKKRNTNSKCSYFSFLAEAEGFEPPWVLPKRFSRPPRYDRFDKPPFIRFFLRFFASLQCLCFRIFCGEKVVVVCCRATFTFARLSNYILFFRKNQLFFSENYCFPNFSVFRLFLSLVCVRI